MFWYKFKLSVVMRRTNNKGTLLFHFLFYLKHIKDIESKSTSGVTATCRNPCTTPAWYSEDDMAYLCSRNLLKFLLKFLLKCNSYTKLLEKDIDIGIYLCGIVKVLLLVGAIKVLLDFLLTVKAAPHECVIRTSQP